MKKRAHKIQQQSIEIHFAGMDDALGIQDRIAEVFYSRLQPQMESLFDEIGGDRHFISLDRLEIDCGVLPNKTWEDEWVEATMRRLKTELLIIPRKLLNARNTEEAFLFFLKNGHMPWNYTEASVKELSDDIIITPGFVADLKKLLSANESVAHRLVDSTSNTLRQDLITAFTQGSEYYLQIIQSICHRVGLKLSDEIILKAFSENRENIAAVFLKDVYHNEKALRKEIETIAAKEYNMPLQELLNKRKHGLKDKQEEFDAIYVQNAGLVLLHPFLQPLFEAAGLTEENAWIDKSSPYTAILMTQHLVDGKDEAEESALPLNKILCGLAPVDLIRMLPPLSNGIKEEANEMLRNVIEHWDVLKNTGIPAFRETFLQRSGKLSAVDNGWLLKVEQKSTDVLLNYLPWGIGIIKLPWMEEIIYVEWT